MSDAVFTVIQVVKWAQQQSVQPLDAGLVPGTTIEQRRVLAALGGVARELAGGATDLWPGAVRQWADDAPALPQRLASDVRSLAQEDERLLERIYEKVVPGRERRRLGTFFTPPEITDFLIKTARQLIKVPDSVIDPGAGVGAISLAASREWPAATVYAVDINVVTLGLLAALCSLRQIASVRFILQDYLRWIAQPPAGEPRVILGNPPYTRHQELPRKLADDDRASSGNAVGSRLASLSAYFVASSIQALHPADALVFVLPGSWTEANYGAGLCELIWREEMRRAELFPFSADLNVFPGTKVNTLILAVGPKRSMRQQIVVTRTTIESGAVRTVSSERRDRESQDPERLGQWLWSRENAGPLCDNDTVALHEIADVRRGVATGANSFFFLREDERRLLPDEATVPAVVQLRHVSGEVYDEESFQENARNRVPCWLLQLPDGDELDERTRAYIRQGEDQGIHESRYLLSHRDPWYRVETVLAPDILVGSMTKSDFRVVENGVRAVPSNSIFGIYLRNEQRSSPALASWLRSAEGQRTLRTAARHYGSGLYKLEPRLLLGIRIPKGIFGGDYASVSVESGRRQQKCNRV